MTLRLTTELDAVNTMLGTIGESPINSLEAATGVADAVTARAVLSEVAVQVLEAGWHFNTDYEYVLTPTADTKEIPLPGNLLEVDTAPYDGLDVAMRGNRLYDRKNKTFSFSAPVKADVVTLMEFNELPQAARHYITIRAARVFQQRVVGSETLGGFTAKDEEAALRAIKRHEARTGNYNILNSTFAISRVLRR